MPKKVKFTKEEQEKLDHLRAEIDRAQNITRQIPSHPQTIRQEETDQLAR